MTDAKEIAADLPTYAIGARLDPKRLADPYSRSRIVRDLIARLMKTIRKLRKQGYVARTAGDATMIGNHNKNRIRRMLRVLDEAHSAEIIGVRPRHVNLVGDAGHASFLKERLGGLEFYYQILYRANIDGQELIFIPEIATADRFAIENALLVYPDAPADDFDTSGLPTRTTDLDDDTFFLQLAPMTEFVSYWYGTPAKYYHAPAHIRMNKAHLDPADVHFLPKPVHGNPAAVDLDRETLCGWRFTTKTGGYPWRVARNAAEAIQMATEQAAREDRSSRSDEPRLMKVMTEQRFYRRLSRKEGMDRLVAELQAKKAQE